MKKKNQTYIYKNKDKNNIVFTLKNKKYESYYKLI